MQLRANELQQQLGVLQKKMLRHIDEVPHVLQCVAVCCSVLQRVAEEDVAACR